MAAPTCTVCGGTGHFAQGCPISMGVPKRGAATAPAAPPKSEAAAAIEERDRQRFAAKPAARPAPPAADGWADAMAAVAAATQR